MIPRCLSFDIKTPLNTGSFDIITMRPNKYLNLGGMRMRRVPDVLHSELERLFTVLNKLAVHVDPCETLSELSEALEDKLNYIKES